MENTLGHIIPDIEKYEVHHKDENPTNNDPSNLALKTKSSHPQGHEFWKKSPRTKPGKRRKAHLIAQRFLDALIP